MNTLYIDTTTFLKIALFDKDHNLVDKELIEEKKQSTLLHESIHKILNRSNLSLEDVQNIVTIAGPGSYTGMRVSEGLAQIFSWHDFQTYSFYHFEIPAFVGEKKYIWTANAFKGEQFLYVYEDGDVKTLRTETQNLDAFMNEHKGIEVFSNEGEYTNTGDLFFKHANIILDKVISAKYKREVYYYRSIEEEFKPSVKV